MDFMEELKDLEYGDDFDDKYADDLDALNELECSVDSSVPSAKRRLDYKCNNGEVRDLEVEFKDEDVIEPPALKRQKIQEDINILNIDNTLNLEIRKSRTENENCSKISVVSTLLNPEAHFKLPAHENISFTTFNGGIFHLRLREESHLSDLDLQVNKVHTTSQSYTELRQEAFKLIEKKIDFLKHDKENELPETEPSHGSLWVEKFKPNDFLELLSDDGINRAVLSWLKLWDKVVFKREAPKKAKKELQTGPVKPKFQEVIKEFDELSRPHQKIVLLCGPPGLGKTTLAYIIAKQAGYNVVEMNASDDRSPDVFKRQLEAATQMRAVLGQEPKPNCLIIDEVDGAAAPAINTLVSFTKNTKRSVLLRPVICICNDLYTPALRPLRQISLVLTFPPTCVARLVSRLLEIARVQQLKTDRSALVALCEKADNDIRSCLSTIQFLHSLKGELRVRDVRSVSVGQKDTQVSIFSVWQNVFQLPKSLKKQDFQNKIQDRACGSGKLATIWKLVSSCGEYEKVLQGLFENYPNVNYRDPQLNRTSLGADWFCFASELQEVINHLQVYTLMSYMPYTVVAFHLLFAIIANVTISYPSAQFEFKTNLNKRENIITSLVQDMPAIARSSLNPNEIILSFLPSLMQIVQPSLRPVNTQLYSNREKQDLQHVVDTMVTYNINYRQERNPDGLYHFVLEPNIDELITFPGLKPHNTLSYSSKQLIARELELEKMRRNESGKRTEVTTDSKAEKVVKQPSKQQKAQPKLNHQQVLQPKPVSEVQAVAKDFFGRKITKVAKEESSNTAFGSIWFRFKEGYTNAARKTLYIKDFM